MHKAHISSFDIWLSFHKRLPRVNIHFVRRMLASGRGGGEGGEGGEGGTATKSFAAFSPDLFLLIDILWYSMSIRFAFSRRSTVVDESAGEWGEEKALEDSTISSKLFMHCAAAAEIALKADKVSSLFMLFLAKNSSTSFLIFNLLIVRIDQSSSPQ